MHSPHNTKPSFMDAQDPDDEPIEIVVTLTRRQWQKLLWSENEHTSVDAQEAFSTIGDKLKRYGITP